MAASTIKTLPHLRTSLRIAIPLNSYRTFSNTNTMQQEIKNMPQAGHFPAMKQTMLPKDSFKNKVVFISGGGTGLGKGMATKFSDLGAKVAIASRRLNVLEDAAKGKAWHFQYVTICIITCSIAKSLFSLFSPSLDALQKSRSILAMRLFLFNVISEMQLLYRVQLILV